MNLKKSRGTATELSACCCNKVMQNLALPLACHTVSVTLAILSLKDEKEKKKQTNYPFLQDLVNLLIPVGQIFGW